MLKLGIFYVEEYDYCLKYGQMGKHLENIYVYEEVKLTVYAYDYKKFNSNDIFFQKLIGNKKVKDIKKKTSRYVKITLFMKSIHLLFFTNCSTKY